jgi:hypothetical protein
MRAWCLVLVALLAPGCPRPRAAAATHVLAEPPEVADAGAPRGRRLLPAAPPAQWRVVARFPSVDACEAARAERFLAALERARGRVAEAEVPADLDVRRTVNARCLGAAAP